MRILLLVTACVLVSGCMGNKKQVQVAAPQPIETIVNSDCYTVDLFTDAKIQTPDDDVPEPYRRFLGEWGGGAWDDIWCHDLRVTDVHADGRVELVDMHAPHEEWNYPATAFSRTARIDGDGNLRFAYGTERHSYRIENGKLVGHRSGAYGNLRIELKLLGQPPIPTPKPVRMVQLAETQPGG